MRFLLKLAIAKIISNSTDATFREGLGYAVAAYSMWGLAPLYFVLVEFAWPTEIIVHRIFWSLLLLLALLWAKGNLGLLRDLSLKQFAWLGLSGVLLATNWWVFVWALQNERVMETSVGYYINPLLSVVLGVVVLGEKLRRWQWVAVLIAALGLVNELVSGGTLPLVALVLATSFGFYGLVRKSLGLEAVLGLTVETVLMLPLAMIGFYWLLDSGDMRLPEKGAIGLFYLALGGIVTSLPLLCFNAAAVRLPLVILGMIQYLAPSLTLLLAVFYYGEAFTPTKWITFGLVWLGLLVFTVEGLATFRASERQP